MRCFKIKVIEHDEIFKSKNDLTYYSENFFRSFNFMTKVKRQGILIKLKRVKWDRW